MNKSGLSHAVVLSYLTHGKQTRTCAVFVGLACEVKNSPFSVFRASLSVSSEAAHPKQSQCAEFAGHGRLVSSKAAFCFASAEQ